MRLLLILAIGFIACTQQTATEKKEINDTLPETKIDTSVAKLQLQQDSVASFDSTIYSQAIPQHVTNLINQRLPQWRLPHPNNWDAFWFNEYKKDSALVNYISGDFNCDGQLDYAVLLTNTNQEFAVWVLQSNDEGYKPIQLDKIGHMERPVEVGLLFTSVGQLDYWDEDAEDFKSTTLKCPAISVLYFEKAAWTYFWDGGRYREVQTSD